MTKLYDSKEVQLLSLNEFMNQLLYRLASSSKGFIYVTEAADHAARPIISFNNAVRLHNDEVALILDSDFHPYFVERALLAKTVDKVGLHLKDKKIETNKDWVKFTNYSESLMWPILRMGGEIPYSEGQEDEE